MKKDKEDELAETLGDLLDALFDEDDDDDVDAVDDAETDADLDLSDELDNVIVLNDEDGNEIAFEFLDLIEYKGEEYVVLLPEDEDDDADQVVILKVECSEDEELESYVSVEDDQILNAVFDIFKKKFNDTFNFVD